MKVSKGNRNILKVFFSKQSGLRLHNQTNILVLIFSYTWCTPEDHLPSTHSPINLNARGWRGMHPDRHFVWCLMTRCHYVLK